MQNLINSKVTEEFKKAVANIRADIKIDSDNTLDQKIKEVIE